METQPDRATISVVVPTRTRAEHGVACARELLHCVGFLEMISFEKAGAPLAKQ